MPFEQIYSAYLRHCCPYSPSGVWQELRVNTDFRIAPVNCEAALASLREQFSDDDLRNAGIAVDKPDETLELNPVLCGRSTIIFPLRGERGQPPFDLLVEAGSISGNLPACAAMRDGRVRELAGKRGYICLTFSMADMAALSVVGIPAVPAWGLADISRDTLKEFCDSFGLRRSKGEASAPRASVSPSETPTPTEQGLRADEDHGAASARGSAEGLDLILVGWSPSRLTLAVPEQYRQVIAHFAVLEKHLKIPMDDVYMWHPRQADLDRVVFCLQSGTRQHVREALSASIDRSTDTIAASPRGNRGPKDLREAITRLQRVLRQPTGMEDIDKQAWARYEEKVNSELVAPLLELASKTDEPAERSLVAAAASITQILNQQAMLIAGKITRRMAESGLRQLDCIPEKEAKRLVEMAGRLVDLNKELRQCRQHRPARPSRR